MAVNVGAAIRAYLLEDSTIALAVSNNITIGYPEGAEQEYVVPPFFSTIIINPMRGGAGYIGLGLIEERIDICCYGVNDSAAYDLSQLVDKYLLPRSMEKQSSFTRLNTRIKTVTPESGALLLRDSTMANWPYVLMAYLVVYSGVEDD